MIYTCVNKFGMFVDILEEDLETFLLSGGRVASEKDFLTLSQSLVPVGSLESKPEGVIKNSFYGSNKSALFGVCYNASSKEAVIKDTIPYLNGVTHNFENDVILDIWANHRESWINSKYVSILSWRFPEKTGLSFSDVADILSKSKKEAVVFSPKGYERFEHPFSRKGYASVLEAVDYLDAVKAFKYKMVDFTPKQIVWCNYWALQPELFDLYCTSYLSKAILLLKDTHIYNMTEPHRDSNYVGTTFFLEGLFSFFLYSEKLSFKKF